MNLELITKQVVNITRVTGSLIKRESARLTAEDIRAKDVNNFVTRFDTMSEDMLVRELSRILPEAGFIAEENQARKKGKVYNWVIDPIDGTTNFIHGIPLYTLSIGLIENDEPVCGVIYEPNLQECFYAWKGGKAWLNGHQVMVSGTRKLSDSLLATGFPYTNYKSLEAYMEIFNYFIRNTRGLRRMGSAALDMAWVACGRFDGFYEYGLSPWDVAAGSVIVQEAGGVVRDFKGGDDFLFGQELVCSNQYLEEELKEVIERFFRKENR